MLITESFFGLAWNFRLHYGAPISKSDSFFFPFKLDMYSVYGSSTNC